jgi:hypothetical protein
MINIDYNNKAEIKGIKNIKQHPAWNEYQRYVEAQIEKLTDINTIETIRQLDGRKHARKLIKDILLFINS